MQRYSIDRRRDALVTGSLGQIAKDTGKSLAETFVNADVVVIVDTSGSMASPDSRDSQARYNVACDELAQLQNTMPGKIAVLSFSDQTLFCPSGKPVYQGLSTNLAGALTFARVADVPDMRFVLISDGEPDEPRAALAEARKYHNHIDVVYVGPEHRPDGRDFLERLAKATGGQAVTADRANLLADTTIRLLVG